VLAIKFNTEAQDVWWEGDDGGVGDGAGLVMDAMTLAA